jgi:hypothetical protein
LIIRLFFCLFCLKQQSLMFFTNVFIKAKPFTLVSGHDP